MNPLLEVKSLCISAKNKGGVAKSLLQNIDFEVEAGEILGITGHSGSGKSLTALSVLGLSHLIDDITVSGDVFLNHVMISNSDKKRWQKIRGKDIAIILQNPQSVLNPIMKCAEQLKECIQIHNPDWKTERVNQRLQVLLQNTQLHEVEHILWAYPHQLSGGQLQRIAIAMAMANHPKIIIADEPTSSLDSTTASNITDILVSLCKEENTSLIYISHDIEMLESISDTIMLIQKGQIEDIVKMKDGQHVVSIDGNFARYKAEMQSLRPEKEDCSVKSEILRIEHVSKSFANQNLLSKDSNNSILKDISLTVRESEMLGIFGESGSGKTTLAKIIAGLIDPDSGSLFLNQEQYNADSLGNDRNLRKKIQMVLQDGASNLQPKMNINNQLREVASMYFDKNAIEETIHYWMDNTALPMDILDKYPNQLSGGQQQRVALIKSLLTKPTLIIFDESLAALDRHHQDKMMDLIMRLQVEKRFGGIFISHDMRLIEYIAHRAIELCNGQIAGERQLI